MIQQILVLASENRHKGSSIPSFKSPVVDEEQKVEWAILIGLVVGSAVSFFLLCCCLGVWKCKNPV